jgi:hypothetical protein
MFGDMVQIRKVCMISALTGHTRKQFFVESRKNDFSEECIYLTFEAMLPVFLRDMSH